jgi:hypothetical protein
VESGDGTTQRPGWMYQRLVNLGNAGTIKDIGTWSMTFRKRTGLNVNYSINAVGKLLRMIADSSI